MLSKQAKSSIKTIFYLQDHPDQTPLSAKVISEEEHIPYKFLENIRRDLKTHQLVKSVCGMKEDTPLPKIHQKLQSLKSCG